MSETIREIVISNLRLRELSNDLPPCVFPVDVSIELSRSTAKDNFLSDSDGVPMSHGSNYPFDVKTPRPKPYIPRTTVRFTNPVECAEGGGKNWDFPVFADKLSSILDRIEEAGTKQAADRVYITNLRLVEIPEEYTQKRDGSKSGLRPSPEAYKSNIRVGICTFSKRATVPKHVRKDLTADIAPGSVIQPMKLTELKEVTVKEYAKARPRRKYYRSPSAADGTVGPVVNEEDDVTWELATDYGQQLTDSGTVVPVEWKGHREDTETFVMDSAEVLDPDDIDT